MHPNKRFLIIGTGALGGYIGAKLCKAGFDVHFLLRSDYDHVKEHGLKVCSPYGNFNLPSIQAYKSAFEMPKGDIIIITLKTFSNFELASILPPILHKDSLILLIQNGLHEENYLATLVNPEKILGGLAVIGVVKEGPGAIKHMDFGSIKIGEYSPNGIAMGTSPRLRQIAEYFTVAGIDAQAIPDLLLARWEKLAWNIPFNGLSVVLNANTETIVSNYDSLKLSQDLVQEVGRAAAACGKIIHQAFLFKMIEMTKTMVPYLPSMKIDYDAGRPMEIESIFGNPLRAAIDAGCEVPCIGMIYGILKFMEKARASGKTG